MSGLQVAAPLPVEFDSRSLADLRRQAAHQEPLMVVGRSRWSRASCCVNVTAELYP